MYYLKVTSDTSFLTGAFDGRPYNFDVKAFPSKSSREKFIDKALEKDYCLSRITRREVENYFGRNLDINSFGSVDSFPCEYPDIENSYLDKLYKEVTA